MITIKSILKKALALSLMSLFWVNVVHSQNGPMQERVKAQQVAFFTEKINLSPAEAKKFWPVYEDYSNRRENIRIEGRNLLRSINLNGENMTEAEINDTMRKYIENQDKEHELFIEYNKKFRNILPPEKVLLIYVAENQFKQYLLNQIRGNRHGRGPGGRF